MENVILIIVLAIIVGLAAFYIYRAKKKGQKCIGCPYASSCPKSHCGCGHKE